MGNLQDAEWGELAAGRRKKEGERIGKLTAKSKSALDSDCAKQLHGVWRRVPFGPAPVLVPGYTS